ncbi:MAG: serine/threonine protein kinase [Lentisphaerales bacterium]|nr:serine/threonine protein kinase [Lentisphaerales bacterium]
MESLQEFYAKMELLGIHQSLTSYSGPPNYYFHNKLSKIQRKDTVQLGELIGEGGQKKVYQACLEDGSKIAIATPLDSSCKIKAEKLCKEAYIAKRLTHPHILKFYDYGIDSDYGAYIAMPLIEGKRLSDYTSEELDIHLYTKFLIQICRALSFAHSRDVFHGDLKAENILVEDDFKCYLIDWGAAYALPSMLETDSFEFDYNTESRDGYLLSTYGCIPPELSSREKCSEKTDIYQLGMMIRAAMKNYSDSRIKSHLLNICNKACHPRSEKRFDSVREILVLFERIISRDKASSKSKVVEFLSTLVVLTLCCSGLTKQAISPLDYGPQSINNQSIAK